APDARMYKTGDLARYRQDGTLEYCGRIDNQVKIRGYRIELGEIDATMAAHPDVQSAVVGVREDTPGGRQLAGYVGKTRASALTADTMQAFLRERLPDYMVPAHIVFLDQFPLTENGKVDRRALPAPVVGHADEAPFHTETEKTLAAAWAELLRVERIGR